MEFMRLKQHQYGHIDFMYYARFSSRHPRNIIIYLNLVFISVLLLLYLFFMTFCLNFGQRYGVLIQVIQHLGEVQCYLPCCSYDIAWRVLQSQICVILVWDQYSRILHTDCHFINEQVFFFNLIIPQISIETKSVYQNMHAH